MSVLVSPASIPPFVQAFAPYGWGFNALVMAVAALLIGLLLRLAALNRALRGSEASLTADRDLFRALADTAVAAIFVIRGNQVLFVNPAACRISGYDREALLSMGVFELVHPDYREQLLANQIARQAGESVPSRYDLPLITRQGAVRWVEASFALARFRDEDAIVGTLYDVTELREAQQRLFRSLFSASPLPKCSLERRAGALALRRSNIAFDTLFGETDRTQPLFADWLARTRCSMTVEGWERLLGSCERDSQSGGLLEMHFEPTGRPALTCLVSASRVGDEWLIALVDITARREAEQARDELSASLLERNLEVESLNAQLRRRAGELEQLSRAKSAFLAGISHEVRTPMHQILGLSELLAEEVHDPAQRELLDALGGAASGLMDMLGRVLEYTALEAGSMARQDAPFDPAEPLRTLACALSPMAVARGLHLEVDIAGSAPTLVGDAGRIAHILQLLGDNALKFTPSGRISLSLEVAAADTDGRHPLTYVVRDTGIGIAEEALPRLFQPFVQQDASSTRRYGGLGLGLAIARQSAQLIGADLSVRAQPGQGSEFRLSLSLPAREAVTSAA